VRKYEQKKRIFYCEIDVYRQEKSDMRHKLDDVRQSDSRDREKTAGKRSMTTKKSHLDLNWKFFLKKGHSNKFRR